MQGTVWGWWDEFWNEFVPLSTKGEPYAVVVNGDLVDGKHHNSTTQISQNLNDQRKMAIQVLERVHNLCQGRLYIVRGTPVHSGESGCDEEAIAKAAGAATDSIGNASRNDLWIRSGGALCHFMHHIGTASRLSYETSAVMAEMGEEFQIASRYREVPPDVVVRSHRHANIEVSGPTSNYRYYAVVTPGWQLKTPFAWKVAGARMVPPQFGGIVVRQGSQHHFVESYVKMLKRGKVEQPMFRK